MGKDLERRNSFILVAADCPIETGTPPPTRDGKATIASIHYELL
ncbi:MAG: hypothetical protein Q8M76_04190 [Spirochaetaceae bacterium]|nr:hypothetical protein [Spirochaetaceae bacterium]